MPNCQWTLVHVVVHCWWVMKWSTHDQTNKAGSFSYQAAPVPSANLRLPPFIMDDIRPLTPNSCVRLFDGFEQVISTFHPVMQVRSHRKVLTGCHERYRMLLSDGTRFIQVLLSQSENQLIRDGILAKNSIVEILSYTTVIMDRRK